MDDNLRHRQVQVGDSSLHVVEAGTPGAPPVVFVHGFPTSWVTYRRVLELAAPSAHAIAVDLPGVGGSLGDPTDGTKKAIAGKLYGLFEALGLRDVTLVGSDVGGMAAFAYLRHFPGLARAVILHVVIPGVFPWEFGTRDPSMWHFHFNAMPGLPEALVAGRERQFFDHWYDNLSGDGSRISEQSRQEYVRAYQTEGARRTAFSWYRAMPRDVAENQAATTDVTTPLLYLHGAKPAGHSLDPHVKGFLEAGIRNVSAAWVPDAGHLAHEQNPEAYWSLVADFAGIPVRSPERTG
ncbi:alpha/beta fold hydrolase [Micromonospora sp. NBC_01796]|uniref:alpha/beta fold hydrolase n=1 Tax=Micromonospora sp. NBC_01796 TaxID=2975987 RepID=UPI002DD7DF1F|nr:alpha/beta hydrolase [Micromonospora sp. NBC_01796]WSA87488.1 alpha/beta hydrolase [Micromonospora sp. NBC_01796]